jgi:hypothetical protein
LTDHEFQLKVIESLSRLETKMDALVGEDGNGGWKAAITQQVEDLEKDKWKRSGASGILGALFGGLCQFVGHYVFSGGRH